MNALTVKDVFLIPVVDELLDKLHGARFFTKARPAFGVSPGPNAPGGRTQDGVPHT